MASPGRWCRRLSARDVRAVALRRRRDASGSGFYAKGQGAEHDAGGGCDTDKADVTASVQPLPKPARGSIVDVEKGNCKSARDDYSSVWSIAESLSWTWNHQNLFIASSTSMSITPSAQNRGADKELRWANHDSSIKAFHRVSPMKLPPPLQLGQSLSFPATSEPPGVGGGREPSSQVRPHRDARSSQCHPITGSKAIRRSSPTRKPMLNFMRQHTSPLSVLW